MAFKTTLTPSLVLFLIINLLFFTLSSSWPKPARHPPPPPCADDNHCPMDALKLGVCADVLTGLLNITVGDPPNVPCCPLLGGLLDVEAAVCLCTAIKADILGIHLNIPINLSLLLNYCGKDVPRGFICP